MPKRQKTRFERWANAVTEEVIAMTPEQVDAAYQALRDREKKIEKREKRKKRQSK